MNDYNETNSKMKNQLFKDLAKASPQTTLELLVNTFPAKKECFIFSFQFNLIQNYFNLGIIDFNLAIKELTRLFVACHDFLINLSDDNLNQLIMVWFKIKD